jgi:PTH1 family peptidyl-tRNA hydrolase
LAKPQTYMNNSGQAARAILDYYKMMPKKLGLFATKDSDLSDHLIVIHDDIDIELGQYKISVAASSAGHNGVQSIINHAKTKNFKRVRIGIKNEVGVKIPTEKLVMQNFSQEELAIVKKQLAKIAEELL